MEIIEYYSYIQENAIDKIMIIEYYSIEFLAGAQLELFLQASMREKIASLRTSSLKKR